MRIIRLQPTPPEGLTPKQAEAWVRGYQDGQITGPESMVVVTPYDVDEEADLYEAWQEGMYAADGAARFR
jgi:hypothetical protein